MLLLAAAAPLDAQQASPTAGADSAARPAAPPPARPAAPAQARRAWYDRISLRGYTQFRYNRLLETNEELQCPQCDRSIGKNGGFFLRRVRLVFSGDVSDRVSIYIQPDFASDAGTTIHVGQIRDAYFDVALNADKSWRARIGQSKVPFGWENMQSSSNRLPLDRSDAINSAQVNERDLGVFMYWAPRHVRERLKILTDSGLKGSGDYGALGFGVYNGEGGNRAEAGDNPHAVARFAWPFRFANGQFLELGVQGYVGEYVIAQRTTGATGGTTFDDARAAATFVLYPQPFGITAEWNVGRGPEAVPELRAIEEKDLEGGFVLLSYRARPGGQVVIPFVRAHRYDGGKKFELDARRYRVRELELGTEWTPFPAMELTAMYTISDRTWEDIATPVNRQKGQLLRLQVQFNY